MSHELQTVCSDCTAPLSKVNVVLYLDIECLWRLEPLISSFIFFLFEYKCFTEFHGTFISERPVVVIYALESLATCIKQYLGII